MQWLIDLVIEAIGVPPVFIDRGDPVGPDWDQTDLTLDGNWNALDVSAIIPANASAILIGTVIRDDIIGKTVAVRKSGHVNGWNVSGMFTQVANVFYQRDFIVAASTNQKIEYSADAGVDVIFFTIRGWWL